MYEEGEPVKKGISQPLWKHHNINCHDLIRAPRAVVPHALFFRDVFKCANQFTLWVRASPQIWASLSFCFCLEGGGWLGSGENSAAVCPISEWGRNNEIISTPINPNLTDAAWNATTGGKQNKARIQTLFCGRQKTQDETENKLSLLMFSSVLLNTNDT